MKHINLLPYGHVDGCLVCTKVLLVGNLLISEADSDCHLTVQYIPGQQNVWTDAPFWFTEFSVHWHLCRQTFCSLTAPLDHPDISLFVALDSHVLPLYLT